MNEKNELSHEVKNGKLILNMFIEHMHQKRGWIRTGSTDYSVTYQKQISASKGSCLISLLLLLFLVLPGILYLYYTSKPAKTFTFMVDLKSDGLLVPSGDPIGIRLFNKFYSENKNIITPS